MALNVKRIEKLPEGTNPRPTHSRALEAVHLALDEPGKPVEVSGEEPEVQKFYKLVIQWRARNRNTVLKGSDLQVRKGKGVVYLWVEKDGQSES